MTEYKKVGTKKIDGKKQPVNVYKKAGSSKLYVMHKTVKSKFMSYVNYKKMYAKKLAAKKVVKSKVVKRRRPTSKRGGQGCGYNMDGGYEKEFAYKLGGGTLDNAITGIEYEKNEMDNIIDQIQSNQTYKENPQAGQEGGKRKKRKKRKGGSGFGYHELNGGAKKKKAKKRVKKGAKKGGNSDDDVLDENNGFNNDDLLLGGERRRYLNKNNKSGRRKIGGNSELDKLHEQLEEISMEGGKRKKQNSHKNRQNNKIRGGDLDELLGGARKKSRRVSRRVSRRRIGGDLDELLGGARKKSRSVSRRRIGGDLDELLGGSRRRRRGRPSGRS